MEEIEVAMAILENQEGEVLAPEKAEKSRSERESRSIPWHSRRLTTELSSAGNILNLSGCRDGNSEENCPTIM